MSLGLAVTLLFTANVQKFSRIDVDQDIDRTLALPLSHLSAVRASLQINCVSAHRIIRASQKVSALSCPFRHKATLTIRAEKFILQNFDIVERLFTVRVMRTP